MQIIEPSYEIKPFNAHAMLENLERIARTCYKSEPKGEPGKFIQGIIKRGHEAMIEHEYITVRFIHNRGFCYDDQTEVLTRNGWKLFKNTNKHDLFLTLNINNQKAEYQKRTNYICQLYNGELLCGKSTMIDFAVTPNHRMYFYPYDKRINKKWTIDNAENIFNKRVKFQRGLLSQWDGENFNKEYIYQQDVNFAKFLGIWFTDGSLYNGKKHGSGNKITICQRKYAGREYIENLLKYFKYKISYTESSGNYTIHNMELFNFLNKYFPCGSNRKINIGIPLWIKNSSHEYINAFLEGCMVGDGSIHKKNKHMVLYAPSQKLADDYQELFLKIGLCSSIRIDDRIGMKQILNNNIIENKLKSYIVSVTQRTNEHFFNKQHWFKKQYNGEIFCVTVPNGILYVRRNGKAFWSGNSHELVRHRIANFAQESTRFCNYSTNKFGNELTFIKPYWKDITSEYNPYEEWIILMKQIQERYMHLINVVGLPPQAARGILPNDLKTEIVITANLREWRNIFKLRCAADAHPDMHRVMIPLQKELHKQLPEVFDL